jgi:hypothetical protein
LLKVSGGELSNKRFDARDSLLDFLKRYFKPAVSSFVWTLFLLFIEQYAGE